VGDCFDWPGSTSQPVVSVTIIRCGQAHSAQVFAIYDLSGSSFPANMPQVARQGCLARVANLSSTARSLDIGDLRPEQLGWDLGDRKVNCVIISSTPDLKSSLLNP
jgi:hypothetical protein